MEKRSKRKFIELSVKFIMEDDYSTIFDSSLSRNISTGGFCLRAYKKVDIGNCLIIRFFLADMASFIEAKARVVWVKELFRKSLYEIGINFIDIKPDLLKKINSLIQ